MIDPKAITTYAQYNEDLILLALLYDVPKGFYVDVGANYPTIDSVTKLFYERGWRGINIEPLKDLHSQLVKARPKDINLWLGIGNKKATGILRAFTKVPGHSTFLPQNQSEPDTPSTQYSVPMEPLLKVLVRHKVEHIHFLKIDVEGFEYQVIESNDWTLYRPEVICIEANHILNDWRPILSKNKYKLFIADGLNEYYIALECWNRTKGFEERIIQLDYHALKQHQQQSWASDSRELIRLLHIVENQNKQFEKQHKRVESLQNENVKLSNLTLANQSWALRLKRSIYGLTIDWIKYKRSM